MTPEQYIKREIKESGMTIKAVSRKTGISYSKLQPTVNGLRQFRTTDYLTICSLLGCDPRGFEQNQTA